MGDFWEGYYFVYNIDAVPVYKLDDQGQLLGTTYETDVKLVVKIEENPIYSIKSVYKKIDDKWQWTQEKIHVGEDFICHPQALVLCTRYTISPGKNWTVNMQEFVNRYNKDRTREHACGPEIEIVTIKGPAEHNKFAIEFVSDPQPDYDADFVTISAEGNGVVSAHGPVETDKPVYLRFSSSLDQSVFACDNVYMNSVVSRAIPIFRFNQTLQSIGQDNLMVTLGSKKTDLSEARSYRIPVLVAK